ncbi:hypothetical protein GOC88_26240 [Sinorhizobium medicae]|nr:hypothetical protein [Sinorhizobium medicae]
MTCEMDQDADGTFTKSDRDGDPIVNCECGCFFIPSAMTVRTADTPRCPVCEEAFKPDDLCASDIELGPCHAECLEGSPIVDLNTGEPLPDAELHTYPASEIMDPSPQTREAER